MRIAHAAAALLLAAGAPLLAAAPASDTARTARLFDALRGQPARLRLFLHAMPKGADLHNHLWGAVYAETMLDEADKAGFCVATDGSAILAPPCDPARSVSATGLARRDPNLYSATIDGLSMRGAPATAPTIGGIAGHDRFFGTFDRFAPIAAHSPARMLAATRERAADDNLVYLETMTNPPASGAAAALAVARHVPADDPPAAFAALAPDLPRLVAAARAETDRVDRAADALLGCGTPRAAPACALTVRYQAFGLRALPADAVFGQLLLAFALVDADPRYVGVNLVAPEDGPVALADYDRHMAMLRYLSTRYPKVPITLHAGELTLGLVTPDQLRDHIGKAVTVAGARRIGHGVDIAHERDAPALLARMARDGIAVEVNLTSNDGILGVRGADHPLALYRAAGVPVILSTDDAGVSRSDMTNEYLRAATEQGLDYPALRTIARASLQYGFLPGESLWQPGAIGRYGPACAAGLQAPSCRALIARSDRAAAQSKLEQALAAFEADIVRHPF